MLDNNLYFREKFGRRKKKIFSRLVFNFSLLDLSVIPLVFLFLPFLVTKPGKEAPVASCGHFAAQEHHCPCPAASPRLLWRFIPSAWLQAAHLEPAEHPAARLDAEKKKSSVFALLATKTSSGAVSFVLAALGPSRGGEALTGEGAHDLGKGQSSREWSPALSLREQPGAGHRAALPFGITARSRCRRWQLICASKSSRVIVLISFPRDH